MAYEPLTPEQFQKARASGFSPEKIIEFEKKRKATLGSAPTPGYNVPAPVVPRETKVVQYKQEATQLAGDSKKANSVLGFAGNFGKELVSNLASSEVGLGKSVAQIAGAFDTRTQKADMALSDSQLALTKLIRKNKAEGKDVTKLQQLYNQNEQLLQSQAPVALPSTGKVVGQLAGTALDTLSAGTYGRAKAGMQSFKLAGKTPVVQAVSSVVPELSQIAKQKSAGLFTKAGLGNVAKGTSIGYGYDVAQGLQNESETPFTPGLGTVLGASLPIIAGGTQSVKNTFGPAGKSKAIDNLEQTYTDISSGTTAGKKKLDKLAQKTEALNRGGTIGKTPQRTLAEEGIIPNRAGTKIDSFEQAQQYRATVAPLRETNREALKEVELSTAPVRLDALEADALSYANTPQNRNSGNFKKMAAQIKKEFNNLREVYPSGEVPLSTVDDIKSARWDNVFGNKGLVEADVLKKNSEYAIAKSLQKSIEKIATSAGHPDVAQLNRTIGDKLEAAKFLEDLNGKTLKGGRLLKYTTSLIGSSLGQTIPGKIIGALGGNVVGEAIIANNVSGPVERVLLRNLKTKDPEAYTATVNWLAEQRAARGSRLALPAGKPAPIVTPAPSSPITAEERAANNAYYAEQARANTLRLPAGKPGTIPGPTVTLPGRTTFEAQSKSPTIAQTTNAITNESIIPQNTSTIVKQSKPMQGKIGGETLALGALGSAALFGNTINNKVGAMVDNMPKVPEIQSENGQNLDVPRETGVYIDPVRKVQFDDSDTEELKKILYSEVGNRSQEKRALEATVIINTALNRLAENQKLGRGPQTLLGVLTADNQYQGYQSKQYKVATTSEASPKKLAVIEEILTKLKNGELTDNTNGAFYYIHNPDGTITYDDKRKLYK